MANFKIVNAYGIFPANELPSHRLIPMFQYKLCGEDKWYDIKYKYQTSNIKWNGAFVAPFHPFLDHMVYFHAVCSCPINNGLCQQTLGLGRLYGMNFRQIMIQIVHNLLNKNENTFHLFSSDAIGDDVINNVQSVRVMVYKYDKWIDFNNNNQRQKHSLIYECDMNNKNNISFYEKLNIQFESIYLNSCLLNKTNYYFINETDCNSFWKFIDFIHIYFDSNNWNGVTIKINNHFNSKSIMKYHSIYAKLMEILLKHYPYCFHDTKEYFANYFKNMQIIWNGKNFYEKQLNIYKNTKKSCKNGSVTVEHYYQCMIVQFIFHSAAFYSYAHFSKMQNYLQMHMDELRNDIWVKLYIRRKMADK